MLPCNRIKLLAWTTIFTVDIHTAKRILNGKHHNNYTDDQIREIIDLLQQFIELDLKKVKDEKGNSLRPSFNR